MPGPVTFTAKPLACAHTVTVWPPSVAVILYAFIRPVVGLAAQLPQT